MTSQHDKAKRWRLRFSVRTLVLAITVTAVVAAWWPTPERRRAAILQTLRRNANRVADDTRGEEVLDLLDLEQYEPKPGITFSSFGWMTEREFGCDCSIWISYSSHGHAAYHPGATTPDWANSSNVTQIMFWTWHGQHRVEYSISDGFQKPTTRAGD